MAERSFVSNHRNAVGMRTQNLFDSRCFVGVIMACARRMGIDIVNFLWLQICAISCLLHGLYWAFLGGLGEVMAVSRRTVPPDFSKDCTASPDCRALRLEDQYPGPFSQNQAISVSTKRPTRLAWTVVSFRQDIQRVPGSYDST
jgi:hypothetical protein